MAHAAFVVILLGVLVTSQFGFRLQEFPVTIGTQRAVGQDTGLSIEARSFSDTYYPDDRPADYVSNLVLFKDGQQIASQDVRVNTPLRHDGVTIYQSYFGVAAVVRVTDSAGTVLFDGGVPMQYATEDGRHVFGSITLPNSDMKLFVVSAASGRTDAQVAPGTVQVDAVPLGQEDRVDTQVIDQGDDADVAGYTVAFERERQFTGLSVARDPGSTIVWIGSALMTLGPFVTMFVKHRRIWVRIRALQPGDEGYEDYGGQPRSRVLLASADRHDTGFEGRFRRLSNEFPRVFSTLPPPDDRADSPSTSTSATQSKAGRP